MSTNDQPLGIFAAMRDVMRDVEPVRKDSENTAQNYRFRGIDAFMNALNPAMSKHGVVMTPRVTSCERTERARNNNGGVTVTVLLTVEFVFYGPDGSSVSTITIGEANDTADKAANKAMSAALKYALMQTFLVPTRDLVDADAHHDEGVSAAAAQQNAREAAAPPRAEVMAALDAACTALDKSRAVVTEKWRRQHNVGPVGMLDDESKAPTFALHEFVLRLQPFVEAALAQSVAGEGNDAAAADAVEQQPVGQTVPPVCGFTDETCDGCVLDPGHAGPHSAW